MVHFPVHHPWPTGGKYRCPHAHQCPKLLKWNGGYHSVAIPTGKWFLRQVYVCLYLLFFSTSPFFHAGFPPEVCEGLWLKYHGGPLTERSHLLAVLIALKMNPTVDQLQRILGVARMQDRSFGKNSRGGAWLYSVSIPQSREE